MGCLFIFYRFDFLVDFFLVGFLVGFGLEGFLPEVVPVARSGMSVLVMGEPRPVQASHPGSALKLPLLPEVMSRKPDLALAA